MKRRETSEFVSGGSAIVVLLLLCEGVLGVLVTGATGTGTTSISGPASCSAVVGGSIPAELDINNGDDVIIYYDVSLSDTRSPNSDPATHYFNMTISYTKWSGDQWAEWEVETDGGDSDSRRLSITVIGVEEDEMIGVIWMASISCPPTCSDFDEISGGINLT